MKIINGGVTTPLGYKAAGVACGIKKENKKDLAIVYSKNIANAVGVFTTNAVKGHSLKLTMKHIVDKKARAIVINSGNANACVGKQGDLDAIEMASYAAKSLNCERENILINSTGVIGQPLNMDAIYLGIQNATHKLCVAGSHDAAEAIMTTDTVFKEIAVEFEIENKKVKIGAMAKGSGMIHPNMATMIGIITTDANISKDLLDKTFKNIVNHTFNRISVDGDTSVCDMTVMLANGKANNKHIENKDKNFQKFEKALEYVCIHMAKKIAGDGEGATKLIEIEAVGASSADDAYKVVCSVAKSPLVKTAIFGEDANWGRIITAVGYSGAIVNENCIDIFIGNLQVCKNGTALNFDENIAKQILSQKEIKIVIQLNQGTFKDRMWTCDFSYDYVKINGSYRS